MKLGFIGFGEVGFEIASGLKEYGVKDILAFDLMHDHPTYAALVHERVAKSGVILKTSAQEVVENATVLLVAVPGGNALKTAEQIAPYIKEATLYVDLSASAPSIKKQIAAIVAAKNALFADGAMLGSLPLYKHKVPTLISGSGAQKFFDVMKPFEMDLEIVSEQAGDATGIKFVRSIFMKGLPALLVEVLEAATIMKVDNLVLPSLYKTMDACNFEQTLNRLVTGSAIHAERRAHEVKEVIVMLKDLGIEPTMSTSTYEKLSWLADKKLKEKFAGKTPKQWSEVVENW